MTALLTHVLLTRYNLAVPGGVQHLDPVWLARRAELFTRYCVPSVLAQTSQDFLWFVLLDAGTPAVFLRGVEEQLPDNGRVVLLARPLDDTPLAPVVHREGVRDDLPLLSSRLDNDDSIGRSYMHLMRTAAESELAARGPLQRPVAFNLPLGLQSASGRVYAWYDRDNPFLSLLEPAGPGLRTVLGTSHREMATVAAIRQLMARPQWLQVVHGSNLDNSVRGLRLPGRIGTSAFASVLGVTTDDHAPHEDASVVARDVVRSTSRVIRLALHRTSRLVTRRLRSLR